MIQQKELNQIVGFYQNSLKINKNSDDSHIVQWHSKGSQLARFKVLIDNLLPNTNSLLDVGCGVGTLVKILNDKKIPLKYTGVDIVKDFVDLSRDRYPFNRFIHANVADINERFDAVYCSGALTYKVNNNNGYYYGLVKKMYELSNKFVIFNMLEGDGHSGIYARYNPNEVKDFCMSFCRDVKIIKGYCWDDFSIRMIKD